MAARPTLTCTTPYGVFSRSTHHKYTHVVISTSTETNQTYATSWHSSLKLANAKLGELRGGLHAWKHEIFPVDGTEASNGKD